MKLPQGLPHLEGMRGTIARIFYLLIALPTLVAVAGGIWASSIDMSHNFPAAMQFGFRTFTGPTGGHFIGKVAPETAALGVREGDRIVMVNGRPIPPGATEFEMGNVLGATSGDTVTLGLRDGDGGDPRIVTIARHPSPWLRVDPNNGLPLWLFTAIHAFVEFSLSIVALLASFLLFRRRPRDPEAMLFAVSILMLCVNGGAFWWWAGSPFSRDLLAGWWMTGWTGAFVAMCGFPDGRFATRWSRILVVALLGFEAMVIAVLASLPEATGDIVLNSAFALAALAAAAAVVLRHRRTPPGSERQQIKWAVGGFCITLAGIVCAIGIFLSGGDRVGGDPLLGGDPLIYLAMSAALVAAGLGLPLGLLVSLLRYRLYDAEAAMSRSAVYAALTVMLLGIFAGSEKIIEALSEQYFGGQLGALAGGMGAALAAVMIAPLHHRLSDWSERRFQQGLARLRKGLPPLVADLRETASLAEIAAAVLNRVESGVRARHAAVIVGDRLAASDRIAAGEVAAWRGGWTPGAGEGLDCDRADPVFPMRVPLHADGCGLVGWILLGPRPDGSFFGKDEREALAEIADPVARAIAIVRERETRQQALDGRIGRIEAALDRLLGSSKTATA